MWKWNWASRTPPDAAARWSSRLWLRPLLQIHDELVFEVPRERLKEAVTYIQTCMDAQPFPEMDVPIVAEAAYGPDFGHMTNWSDE